MKAKLKNVYNAKINGKKESKIVVVAQSLGDALEFVRDKDIKFDDYYVVRRANKELWGKYVFLL